MKVCLAFSRDSPFQFSQTNPPTETSKFTWYNPLLSYNYFRVFTCSRQHPLLGVSFLIVYSLPFPRAQCHSESFNLTQSLAQSLCTGLSRLDLYLTQTPNIFYFLSKALQFDFLSPRLMLTTSLWCSFLDSSVLCCSNATEGPHKSSILVSAQHLSCLAPFQQFQQFWLFDFICFPM